MVKLTKRTIKLIGGKADGFDFWKRGGAIQDELYDAVNKYFEINAQFHDFVYDINRAIEEQGGRELSEEFLQLAEKYVLDNLKNAGIAKRTWEDLVELTRQFQKKYDLNLGLDE